MREMLKSVVRMAKEKKQSSEVETGGFDIMKKFQKKLLKKQKKEK
jgi:hypothetical protein